MMDGFLIFTFREGGEYHAYRGNQERFEKAREKGTIEWVDGFGNIVVRDLAYLAYAKTTADFDFILGSARDVKDGGRR